jgi:prophage regulatory protein
MLPLKEVLRRTTLSKTEVYRRIKKDRFPKPLRIGNRRIAFLESDIDSWIAGQQTINRKGEIDG